MTIATYTGKRVRFAEKGKVEIQDWEQPSPKTGEATIENVASLISAGTELSILYGTHTRPQTYPQNTGYMSVGKVVELGDGVTNVKIGDMVLVGMGHLSHLNVNAANLIVIPANLPPEHAVMTHIAAISLRAVRQARLQIGDSVLVMGMGLIGQFAQIFARLNGGNPVVGVDMSQRRLDLAKATGLRHGIPANAPDFDDQLKATTANGRFMTSIDSTGTPNVIASLPARTAEFGNIIVLGGVHKKVEMDMYTFIQKSSQRIIGAGTTDPINWPYDESANRRTILKLMSDGLINVAPLLTHHVPVAQAPEMYRMLNDEKDKGMGVVLKW